MEILEVTFSQFLENFHPDVRGPIKDAIKSTGATHVVEFENLQFDSGCFGANTAVMVGPTCTHKTVDDVKGKHLYDLPSQREYPTRYAKVPA